MPESRHEKLKSRLFDYARTIVPLQIPRLSQETPPERKPKDSDEEDIDTAGLQPLSINHMRREWKELRSYLLGNDEVETAKVGPNDVDMEAISYLESMVSTLERRKNELEEKRIDLVNQKRSWVEGFNSNGKENEVDTYQETINSLENNIQETEEKISLIGFRYSLAEVMLTQIALLDTVQTWKEFYPRKGPVHESSDISDAKRRAISIGLIVEYIRNKNDYSLRDFESYKECFKRFNFHVDPLNENHLTIRSSLEKLGLWVTEKEGKKAANLREILSNCVDYAKSNQWRPENLDVLKDEALNSVAIRLN